MGGWMYMEGSGEYEYDVKEQGEGWEVGFKDIIGLWKGEKWEGERVVGFYKKIGGEQFFGLGNDDEKMELWERKYEGWN